VNPDYDTAYKTPVAGAMTGMLNDGFAYREELRGGRETPQWRDFDWMRLPARVIPWCAVADVQGDPLDFVYRFWGTARTLLQGKDYTGWSIADVEPKSVAEKIAGEYRAVYENREPVYFETTYDRGEFARPFAYHFLRLPFASKVKPVGHILSVGTFEETDIRKIHDFFGLPSD
jgi:hypothetical protein